MAVLVFDWQANQELSADWTSNQATITDEVRRIKERFKRSRIILLVFLHNSESPSIAEEKMQILKRIPELSESVKKFFVVIYGMDGFQTVISSFAKVIQEQS